MVSLCVFYSSVVERGGISLLRPGLPRNCVHADIGLDSCATGGLSRRPISRRPMKPHLLGSMEADCQGRPH